MFGCFETPGNNSSKAGILLFPAFFLWKSIAEGSSACTVLVFVCIVTKGIHEKLKLSSELLGTGRHEMTLGGGRNI